MGKDVLIMLLGVWVALLPFLGLPNSWDNIIFLISGIFIIGLGIAVRRSMNTSNRRSTLRSEDTEENEHSYAETGN